MGDIRSLPIENTKALIGDVSRQSVRDVIASKIAALVSSGVLGVGDTLPSERELAHALSVSRETIRGAIGILASHGILRVAHGTRTTVASADAGSLMLGAPATTFDGSYTLENVHDARLLVERRIAAQAAVLITGDALGTLRSSVAAQEACEGDSVRFLLCDRDFHATLYGAAGNDALFDIAMSLYNHLLDHRRRIVSQPGSIRESISDHRAILTALDAADADAAVAAVSTHATRIFVTTRAFLDATAS